MTRFHYFAYGSNMLTGRLRHASRCPSAKVLGVARADGFDLAFAKRGADASGKATLRPARAAATYGVLYEIDLAERRRLDAAEGGYARIDAFSITALTDNQPLRAATYLAIEERSGLAPYDWYHALVLAGAEEHALPAAYRAMLARVAAAADPHPAREARMLAHAVLKQHNALRAA